MNPTARHPIVAALTLGCIVTTGAACPVIARALAVVTDIAWRYLSNAAG